MEAWPSIEDATVAEDEPLAAYSTFQLGGPCRRLITCSSPMALIETVRLLVQRREPYVLMGGGSNLLLSDHGFDGTVVRFVREELKARRHGTQVTVSACASLDDLAAYTAREGLAGLMCCTGIPGTVGGAVVGNAGAWGRQIGDVLESAILILPDGELTEATAGDLGFGYRRSRLQTAAAWVGGARFRLTAAGPDALLQEREEIMRKRAERHPDWRTLPCIGSIFRNIEPSSSAERRQAAGWFLEQAGAKEMRVGGARVFEKHANIIVKDEACTAQNVRDLMVRMQQAVREKFAMNLVREVRLLGRFDGEEGQPLDRYF